MRKDRRQFGLTLIEMAVVISIIALLVTIGLPAVSKLLDTFQTGGTTNTTINAALASARAIAKESQRYAGVRFQQDPNGNQYMIYIIQDPDMMAWGYRAIPGHKPIKLPETIGIMDYTMVISRNALNPVNCTEIRLEYPINGGDAMINEKAELVDTTTFSIIFSPSGKLVITGVRVRNRDGFIDSVSNSSVSLDDVFNKKAQVDSEIGQFYQDDYYAAPGSAYANLGLGPEPSRKCFVIYNKRQFEHAFKKGTAWSQYLASLVSDITYVNPFTGITASKK